MCQTLKTALTISSLLFALLAIAQQDISLHVKKLPILTVSPDSMYFNSHTARTFTVHHLPAGAKLRADFTGGDITIRDSTITLTPFYIYRDSDVARLKSRSISGYKTTGTGYYLADLHLTAIDATGMVKARGDHPCYIRPQGAPRTVPLSSATFDPIIRNLIQSDTL